MYSGKRKAQFTVVPPYLKGIKTLSELAPFGVGINSFKECHLTLKELKHFKKVVFDTVLKNVPPYLKGIKTSFAPPIPSATCLCHLTLKELKQFFALSLAVEGIEGVALP